MFAGPNGSGKTTLISRILRPELLGAYFTWLAEITDGRVLEMKTDRVPAWFKRAVLDKITPA
jgi:ABC-type multidrug transport system ATPase subunit